MVRRFYSCDIIHSMGSCMASCVRLNTNVTYRYVMYILAMGGGGIGWNTASVFLAIQALKIL